MHNLNFEIANALYIHIPFCSSKCPYCDFYSIKYTQNRVDHYWAALFMELEELYRKTENKLLQTIYIGGGTPSLIDSDYIYMLIKEIKNKFKLSPTAEITIEVNPTSINKEKLIALKKAGINRLSVGIQSLNDQYLNFLGRKSSRKKNIEVLKLISQYFNNYSADLIFALPDQRLKEFEKDLKELLDFNPPHISLYNLEIHKGTEFYKKYNRGELKLPSEEMDADMYHLAQEVLLSSDYQHYEISNFAKKGYRARHNYIYWLYQPYLALGPGAAGFDGKRRYQNPKDIDQYIEFYNFNKITLKDIYKNINKDNFFYRLENIERKNKSLRKINNLNKKEQMAEYSFLALRTGAGLFFHKFYLRFAEDFKSIYKDSLSELKENGLIKEKNNRIYLTGRGKELANEVFIKFLA